MLKYQEIEPIFDPMESRVIYFFFEHMPNVSSNAWRDTRACA